MTKKLRQIGTGLIVATAMMLPTVFASAQLLPNIQNNTNSLTTVIYGTTTATSLPTLIGRVIQAFLGLIGVVLTIYIIWAGYIWMTARENPKKAGEAIDQIRNAIIGLIIILGAYALSNFVINNVLSQVIS